MRFEMASSISHIEIATASKASVAGSVMNDVNRTKNWYAVTVFPRHERCVARLLDVRDTKYLLPLYTSVRRWKDRRKQMEMVLFPGYVFVNIEMERRLDVLMLPGVARFVTFQGRPVVVPSQEIEAIGVGACSGVALEPHPYLQKGRRVRVRSGPMAGVEGILVRRKDKFRLVLSVDLIMRSVAAEVDEADIEALT